MPRMRQSSPRWRRPAIPWSASCMKSIDHIGQEFFRFEMATAVAGAILGINPFNQPDVEAAKIKTRELTAAFEKTGALPAEEAGGVDRRGRSLYRRAQRRRAAQGRRQRRPQLLDQGASVRARAAAIMSPCSPISSGTASTIGSLQKMRLAVRDAQHLATCAEFGPRFLHSTGQAYKGGPDSGVFLQITADDAEDLAVPGQKASFGVIKAAQARGDFDVLTERGRPGACACISRATSPRDWRRSMPRFRKRSAEGSQHRCNSA